MICGQKWKRTAECWRTGTGYSHSSTHTIIFSRTLPKSSVLDARDKGQSHSWANLVGFLLLVIFPAYSLQCHLNIQHLIQDQETNCLIPPQPQHLHPHCFQPHYDHDSRGVLPCSNWTGYKLLVNIPRPESTLSLIPRGLVKLVGYLKKCSFVLHYKLLQAVAAHDYLNKLGKRLKKSPICLYLRKGENICILIKISTF